MMRGDRGDLRETLQNKARELFALCDPEDKGYATKADLEALRQELPLPPHQLDVVFDALDANGDGKLTLTEFTDGFGMFLGIDAPYMDGQGACDTAEDDDEMLEELLDHLGARNLFTDEEYLREMWSRVRKEDPVMRSNFEKFIAKMTADLKESLEERAKLQSTLKHRKSDHEAQVQSLYMEMEEQLCLEKERILKQEQRKERRLRNELEAELHLKDQQLRDLLQQHAEMEAQLEELNCEDFGKKHENIKLQKDRDELEHRLAASDRMLQDMKGHLTLLRKRSLEDKRKRAQAALKVSEGIALERENLVLELQNLKEINKQLQDENDELALGKVKKHKLLNSRTESCQSLPEIQEDNEESDSSSHSGDTRSPTRREKTGETFRKSAYLSSMGRTFTENHPLAAAEHCNSHFDGGRRTEIGDDALTSDAMSELDLDIQNNLNEPPGAGRRRAESPAPTTSPRFKSRLNSTTSVSSRKGSVQHKLVKRKSVLEDAAPTRVFKVVFVGDSGVGKTSILQRFCTDSFKCTFSATIGVDFQVKTVEVDGERIALQLWDTAGQERFRSMTHQYFRKADGIIVVYDVTSETTFRNVRNWMHNIQEGAQEGAMVLIIGNKVDLCESENDRVVRTKDGSRLADEYGSLFYETSAKTGDSIADSIESLASILKTKEDEAMEHVLKLQEAELEKKKRRCC